jgi:membrane associated rhomboid family serine protease
LVVRVQTDGAERRLTVEEFEAAVTRGEVLEDAPVAVDGKWMRATDWPSWTSLRTSTAGQMHDLWRGSRVPIVTALVVGLILQIQVFLPVLAARGIVPVPEALTRDTTAILERGEGWRLFTYALLHGGAAHVLSNAAGLAVAGWGLERMIGRLAAGMVVLGSVVFGGIASAVVLPNITSVGISGGDFGVLGACAVLTLRFVEFVPRRSRAAFGLGAALLTAQFLYSGFGSEGVDNACHVGGLLSGAALGLAYRPAVAAWAAWNRGVSVVAGAAIVAALLAPLAFGVQIIPLVPYDGNGAESERPEWWTMQVGRSGLGGYGNRDRSSTVSLETSRQSSVQTEAEAFADILDGIHRMDPGASLETGPPGRATVRYVSEGEDRIVKLRVVTRGLYRTVAAVDVAEASRMAPLLERKLLDQLVLDTPDDLVDDLALADSPSSRERLAAAVAAAELGAPDRSAAAFAAERARSEPARVDIAELSVLAALGAPEARARIDAALLAWPQDRRVQAAAARALFVLGDQPAAVAVATALLATAEGDRARTSAEGLLVEVGGAVP